MLFTANIDDVSGMSKILHELHAPQPRDHAILTISKEGLRIITGDSSHQVSAFFAVTMFQRFDFNNRESDKVNFRFSLKYLIESIDSFLKDSDQSIQGDKSNNFDTSLYIEYKKKDDPLLFKFEDSSNLVINVEIFGTFATPNNSLYSPLQFNSNDDICVVTLNSKKVYDYMIGVDLVSSPFVDITMGRDESVKLSTSSEYGESALEIRLDSDDLIIGDVYAPPCCIFNNRYKSMFLKPALEAAKNSYVMQVKCSSSGLLCLQHFHLLEKNKDGTLIKPDMDFYGTANHENPIDQLPAANRVPSIEYYLLALAISPYESD